MFRLPAALWQFRLFVVSSIRNDIRARFAQSSLGALWMIIHPLAMALVFTLVLSKLLAARLPGETSIYAYGLYLIAGLTCWSLFTEILGRLVTVFLDNAGLIKKMVFPRSALILSVIGGAVLNNLLLFAVVIVIALFLDHPVLVPLLTMPPLILLTALLASGLGLTLGVLNVFVRDVGQVVPVVLQFGFWLLPIVYVPEILPENMRSILEINPLFPLVQAYQNALVFQGPVNWPPLLYILAIASVLCLFGQWFFRRARADLMDLI